MTSSSPSPPSSLSPKQQQQQQQEHRRLPGLPRPRPCVTGAHLNLLAVPRLDLPILQGTEVTRWEQQLAKRDCAPGLACHLAQAGPLIRSSPRGLRGGPWAGASRTPPHQPEWVAGPGGGPPARPPQGPALPTFSSSPPGLPNCWAPGKCSLGREVTGKEDTRGSSRGASCVLWE